LKDLKAKSFEYTGTVLPGKQSPRRSVPRNSGIVFPDYAKDGVPKAVNPLFPWLIEVKTEDEIAKMRIAGRAAREVLDIAGRMAKVGVTTDEIDAVVHEETIKRGGYPSPLNYHGFPKSCCTSVNEIICHGIPDDRKLKDGDVINIDITVYVDGYHGDCSEMFVVGECDDDAKQLIQVTYDCWLSAMNMCKPGNDYKDIGGLIEDYVTERGFTTVRNFCGHGIGSVFHSTPNILHYRNNEPAGQMAYGHTFTVEPMICEGSAKHVSWPDEWTAATADGKRTAQFEHTLLVTREGVEPLTGKLPDSPVQFWCEGVAFACSFGFTQAAIAIHEGGDGDWAAGFVWAIGGMLLQSSHPVVGEWTTELEGWSTEQMACCSRSVKLWALEAGWTGISWTLGCLCRLADYAAPA